MPQKRDRDSKRAYVVTLDVLNASLDVGGWEEYWGGPAEGRAAWAELGGRLRHWPGERRALFWAYEKDVPERLRRCPEMEDARIERPPGWRDAAAYCEQRRREWLVREGAHHLEPGEREIILAELDRRPPT